MSDVETLRRAAATARQIAAHHTEVGEYGVRFNIAIADWLAAEASVADAVDALRGAGDAVIVTVSSLSQALVVAALYLDAVAWGVRPEDAS